MTKKIFFAENVISDDLTEQIANEMNILHDLAILTGQKNHDDLNYNNQSLKCSFGWYSAIFTEALLISLQPGIENLVGKKLFPTYSYCRIYYPGAILKKHTDRKSCEYSATLTIKCEGDHWPVYFFDPDTNSNLEVTLLPKSMVVYKGIDITHWRERCTENTKKLYQVFLHYVDVNGEYKDYKFDTRPMLAAPKQYRKENYEF